MKSKHLIILVSVIIVLITLFYSFQGSQDDVAYKEEIEKEREVKDRFMRTSVESPFAKSKETYTSLKYYPPDIRYRVLADLQPIQQKKVVVLSTNDGKEQRYIEYAYASFKFTETDIFVIRAPEGNPATARVAISKLGALGVVLPQVKGNPVAPLVVVVVVLTLVTHASVVHTLPSSTFTGE